jgi:hypothetical protein
MLFKLEGEDPNLEALESYTRRLSECVRKEQYGYYLDLPSLQTSNDADATKAAEQTLARLNAIMSLQDDSYRPPKVHGIARRDPVTGKLITAVRLAAYCVTRTYARAELTVRNEAGEIIKPDPEPTFSEAVWSAAEGNASLRHALQVFGEAAENNLLHLNNALEAIETAYGGDTKLKKRFPEFKDQIRRLTATVNSYPALGPKAKHGYADSKVISPQITCEEAYTLIRTLLNALVKEQLKKSSLPSQPPGGC